MVLSSQKVSKGRSGQEATVIAVDGCYYKKKNSKVRTIVTLQMHKGISSASEISHGKANTESGVFQVSCIIENTHHFFLKEGLYMKILNLT